MFKFLKESIDDFVVFTYLYLPTCIYNKLTNTLVRKLLYDLLNYWNPCIIYNNNLIFFLVFKTILISFLLINDEKEKM